MNFLYIFLPLLRRSFVYFLCARTALRRFLIYNLLFIKKKILGGVWHGEFSRFIRFEVVDGSKIIFWHYVWCGDQTLKAASRVVKYNSLRGGFGGKSLVVF
jgi:hypothetical protein